QIDNSLSTERMISSLSAVFGFLATLLAVIGLYGVMAYTVAQRTREVGIRMALGAARGNVIWMVMREVLLLVAIGVVAGVTASLGLTRVVQTPLLGPTPRRQEQLLGPTPPRSTNAWPGHRYAGHRRLRRWLHPRPARQPPRPHGRPPLRINTRASTWADIAGSALASASGHAGTASSLLVNDSCARDSSYF